MASRDAPRLRRLLEKAALQPVRREQGGNAATGTVLAERCRSGRCAACERDRTVCEHGRAASFFGNAGAVAGRGSVAGLVGAFGCDQAFGVQHALAHRLEAVPSIRVVSRFGCTSSDHLRAPFSIMRQNRAFLATEPRSGTRRGAPDPFCLSSFFPTWDFAAC